MSTLTKTRRLSILALAVMIAIPAIVLLWGVAQMTIVPLAEFVGQHTIREESTTYYFSPNGEGVSRGTWYFRAGKNPSVELGTYTVTGRTTEGYQYKKTVSWPVFSIEFDAAKYARDLRQSGREKQLR